MTKCVSLSALPQGIFCSGDIERSLNDEVNFYAQKELEEENDWSHLEMLINDKCRNCGDITGINIPLVLQHEMLSWFNLVFWFFLWNAAFMALISLLLSIAVCLISH